MTAMEHIPKQSFKSIKAYQTLIIKEMAYEQCVKTTRSFLGCLPKHSQT